MSNDELTKILGRLNDSFEKFTYPIGKDGYAWFDAFKDISKERVEKAVDEFIEDSTADSVPTIKIIQEYMKGMRFRKKQFEDLRKWVWEVQEVDDVYPVSGEPYKRKEKVRREMKYKINRWGDIEDELGRIYADPDENVQQQLVNKVKQTGRLI